MSMQLCLLAESEPQRLNFEPLLTAKAQPHEKLQSLPIEFLQRGQFQPRQEFKAELLQELANSISEQGIIQPIIVRQISSDKFEIIAGERRWRAAQMAGLEQVPVVIKTLDDKAARLIALIENIQREDLNPLETAEGLKNLLTAFAMTHQQLANVVGKSRVAITNFLRLLELSTEVKKVVSNGQLSMGHARALLTLEPSSQQELATKIIQQGLTVRHAESLAKQLRLQKTVTKKAVDTDILQLQNQLTEKINAKVEIKHTPKGSGKLIVTYSNLEELSQILTRFE